MFQKKSNPDKSHFALKGQSIRRINLRVILMALFFCLLSTFAFAYTPTAGTISPSTGATTPDIAKTFTCTYTDLDGWSNLKEAYLLISTTYTALSNSAYLYYDQNTNLLYLRDDANSFWQGGFAPGSVNTIENSQVKLNCAQTTISNSTNTLTVNWNITFKPAYSGRIYNSYLRVVDDTGGSANWTRRGGYTVNYAPQVGTIIPASGTGQKDIPRIFTATYSDSDTWQNIQYVYLLINNTTSTLNSFYGYYNQNTNRLYLRNDANTIWQGGYAPGSANTMENSYAKLDCSQTSISGSGNTLTVNWAVTFKAPFTGLKNTYLYVRDDVNAYQNWVKKGTWTLPNQTPSLGTITPASGTSLINQPVNFTTTYSDPDTWQNIQSLNLLINTSTSAVNSLYGYYNRDMNKLYLRNDANTVWQGGFAPGSANTIENSYAKLDCGQTTVSGSGNTLTINWAVTFKPNFTGAKNTYLSVRDYAGGFIGLTKKGAWNISNDSTPPTGTVSINNNQEYTNANTVSLTLSAQDEEGGSGLSQMQFSDDNITYSTPEAYVTSKSWTLPQGEGTKTVYVKFKDVAGNWSNAVSDEIILDTTPPDIFINPVISPSNQNVTLSYSATDNFTPTNQIQVTGDNSPYINEGDYSITLTARDLAGNAATANTSFTIDKTPPAIIITSPTNGAVIEESPVQFQGTIDGVAFLEERTLTEGENALTKTAADSAGNTASSSVSVYLYSGVEIGPQGGEVLSPDGKIKLIIPEGAIKESPTGDYPRIRIIPVDNQTLQGATPSGQALLTAVEGRPAGLIFYRPATLIYTLRQAEVPGTPVELGLYDSFENQIVPTGQTSVVPIDGYTLTFSINGFSTYAALKVLTPQSTPIGLGVKIPLPDMLTGSFSSSVPLTVPPGRKGLQPSLSLNYRSSNPNSWLGSGFSLNPGYIVRSTRLGPPTYIDTQDTFYFISDVGTTELVNLIDNLYQAKVESSFTKFYKESDDSWRAVAKDGSTLTFGAALDSKEGSSQGTFAWYLTRAQDTNSNYISYTYIKDQGKSYLSRIEYTGNEAQGVSPKNSVEFFLEARSDVPSSYISSSKIAIAKRLKEIYTKVNGQLVWRYELTYGESPDTQRSLLNSITQYAADGKALPEQRFSYQTK